MTGPNDNVEALDKALFCVRSWLSLFGINASTQVVYTQILGTVTVEIQVALANILMLGAEQVAAAVTAANNQPSKLSVGRGAGVAVAQRGAVLAPQTADYT